MLKSLLKNTDYIVLVAVFALFVIGVVAIFSAGYNTDINKDEYTKQIIWMSAVFVMMIVIWSIDYKVFDIAGYILYVINLILLVLVLSMPSLMGANSWFNLGGMLYQPSELMKIGFIICLSKLATIYKSNTSNNDKKKKIILLGIIVLTFSKYRYLLIGAVVVLILVPLVYMFLLNPVQQERIKVFINPELDPLGSGYNAIQSKIAVGSGKLFGTGLLKGAQTQYGYLPIKSTDFIFSVISEEMGFVISVIIVIIYTVLLFRLIRISKYAPDDFSSFMVIGVAGLIFFHFVQNIGMTIGLLPITGVPLPFVSYGGSSLITNGMAIAIALNVSARKSKNLFI